VDGFLTSVLAVKRIGLHEAIEQLIAFRKGKTTAAAISEGEPSVAFGLILGEDFGA
jgi:hypothetical protein